MSCTDSPESARDASHAVLDSQGADGRGDSASPGDTTRPTDSRSTPARPSTFESETRSCYPLRGDENRTTPRPVGYQSLAQRAAFTSETT